MKPRGVQIAILVSLAAAFACSRQSPREIRQYTIEQFMDTKRFTGSSISHDDQWILYTSNESGVFNARIIPVAGGPSEQATNSSTDGIFAQSFFPTDRRFLYVSDKGGNEIVHLYLQGEDGKTIELTPGEKTRATFHGWSQDGKTFFFTSNERDPRFMDLYEMDAETLKPKIIYKNEKGLDVGSISPDRKYVALVKPITRSNTDMYLYEVATRKLTHLSPHQGDVSYFPTAFSKDSKSLYYLTDEGREFSYLKRMNLNDLESVIDEEAPWDIMYAYLSHNGKYKVLGINNDGRTEIRIVETATGKPVGLPKLPEADITSVNISRSEKVMTFYVNGSRSPSELYVYDFTNGQHRKLTDSMNPEINREDLVDAKVVRYKAADGLEIPALYYEPHHAEGEKAPGLVWVHGGPGGQSRIGYSPLIQYLVNHGYAIIAVNNRGSSGYGKTFYKMDDRKHGEIDLNDCVDAKNFLAETGRVDPERIGIIGGSYGGYMVLAALAFRPDAFEVGVDIFGISNWIRTLKSIPPWWTSFRDALYTEMGDPATDEVRLRSISPIFHASNIRKPLLVLQGANDPRVLKVESDEIVAAVKQNNVPVEYVVFDDEGHGFIKKENEIRGYRTILEFLDQHLRNTGS
jgi:dipeptidyl aminopeptidase/acylaminoacyl peptidase